MTELHELPYRVSRMFSGWSVGYYHHFKIRTGRMMYYINHSIKPKSEFPLINDYKKGNYIKEGDYSVYGYQIIEGKTVQSTHTNWNLTLDDMKLLLLTTLGYPIKVSTKREATVKCWETIEELKAMRDDLSHDKAA